MNTTPWTVSDISDAQTLCPFEIEDDYGDFHHFEVLETADRLVFGGACNTGFLESGYILKEDGEDLGDTYAELKADLQTYYNFADDSTTRIVCNERM